MFSFYTPLYASIKATFKYYLRIRFRNRYQLFDKYEDSIVILSVVLFISSSFMFKTKREKYFNFDWKSYFLIYKQGTLEIFSICAIRYCLDFVIDQESKKQIEESMPYLAKDFLSQYQKSFLDKYIGKKRKVIDTSVDLDKYPQLLELVLKIQKLYRDDIVKDSGKVLDLVNYLTQLKGVMFELFKYKAEYILFSFLINLSK